MEKNIVAESVCSDGIVDVVIFICIPVFCQLLRAKYKGKFISIFIVFNEATALMQAEDLLRFTEKSPMLEAFDDQLFTRFVERILIRSRHEAVFHLKCGLTLTERM